MANLVRIGAYSSDPPACDAFHAFDPESYVIISAINDSLIYLDAEGEIRPALAVSWKRVDPLTMEFELRQGVRFHNGEPFDADAVVATMNAQRDPKYRSPTGQGILGPIKSCEKLDTHRVRITTLFPDGMFLHRLHLFSAIYPRGVLEAHGPDYFLEHPIGTGAYRFESWTRGREIVLRRNPEHWANLAQVEELRFPIVPKKDWLDLLGDRRLDIALNIDPHDAHRASGLPGILVRHRPAALSHWFLFNTDSSPLKDRRVRQALNHAVHRPLLARIADHGRALPQTSIQTPGQIGFNAALEPYAYDPDLSRRLLAQAGWERGFTLRGLVSESSSSIYQLVREFLGRVGVQLEAEVVPRGEWMSRVVVARMMGQAPFVGDFVFSNVDNPLLHGLFHHFIFLFSQGPFSQMNNPEYDRRFLAVASETNPDVLQHGLAGLDQYARDEALLLFTTRQEAYYAARVGLEMPISRSGHFNFASLWYLRADGLQEESRDLSAAPHPDPELQGLIEATSCPGLLLPNAAQCARDAVQQLWRNIELGELRWKVQTEEMVRALIDQVAAETRLENISRSTRNVGILVLAKDGRWLFENEGLAHVIGRRGQADLDAILRGDSGARIFSSIRAEVDEKTMWSGVVSVQATDGAVRRVFLAVTPAVNEVETHAGYVCIFSDYSSEEERLRMKAEARTAALVQRALINRLEEKELDIADYYLPASEIGGDWYSVRNGPRYLSLMIGDVTGHGTAAALVTASVAGAMSVIDVDETPLDEVMVRLNQVVASTGFGDYLMSFYIIRIDKQELKYSYCSAGHHSPLIVRPPTDMGPAKIETQVVSGALLGVRRDTRSFVACHGRLAPGSIILLYSDGLSEARNPENIQYGFRGLRRFFGQISNTLPCRVILDRLVENARQHHQGRRLEDDLTLLLTRVGSASATATLDLPGRGAASAARLR